MTGTVSGAVPLGVTITLGDAGTGTTTTDATGTYRFQALPTGSYTVVPSPSGNTFNPVSAAVTINGADVNVPNFAETPNPAGTTFSISGKVSAGTVSGAVVQNVVIALNGGNTGSTLTDATGFYNFSGFAVGTAPITVAATLTGHTYSTPNNTVATAAAGTTATINFTATQ